MLSVVLLAAVLHASWNALVKSGGDPFLRLAIVNLTQSLVVLPLVPFVAVPAVEAWPWLLASVAAHMAYYFLLAGGYRVGDLSHVYPIARGVAPPLVALGALAAAGEVLSPLGSLAVILVCLGIWIVAGRQSAADAFGRSQPLLLALGCGVAIAAYTVADGMGGRASGDVLGYVVWLFLLDGWPFTLVVVLMRGTAGLRATLPAAWKPAVGGGVMSVSRLRPRHLGDEHGTHGLCLGPARDQRAAGGRHRHADPGRALRPAPAARRRPRGDRCGDAAAQPVMSSQGSCSVSGEERVVDRVARR